ncbi:succinyldiaminopimelate transaminase [Brachybacterium timonense]|uniref:succinyldiaminopimelate transaminase n=1 Tax=Brachybacterium timonense TaxID=2050896 RepID=UPI000D0ABDAA|nr:succinyldiaminopimelate transaminase [Brachybacterium timonense]
MTTAPHEDSAAHDVPTAQPATTKAPRTQAAAEQGTIAHATDAQAADVRTASAQARRSLAGTLPAFPWDALTQARATAAAHSDGIVDLSVGTPVDPTPEAVQRALAEASNSPGYPTTQGTDELRDAIVDFTRRRRGAIPAVDRAAVLPTIGSKELVAHLPFQLGIRAGEVIVHPAVAYPTYDMGARLVGAHAVGLDPRELAAHGDEAVSAAGADPDRVRLLWLNSPSNPTGEVLDADTLAALVTWARSRGIVIASDECYALLPWTVDEVPSVLDARVNGGRLDGLLCVYSLSKQSNLAGYRAAFVAGDPELIGELLAVRKQAGMMLPGPVQHAMTVALGDDDAVRHQHERYRARREVLAPAVEAAGGRIHGSQAGLYLWTTFGEDALESVARLAEAGILVAPGVFYGGPGGTFVRIALTATDERIAAAAERLHRL